MSGCMAGMQTGWLGDDNGMHGHTALQRFLADPRVQPVPFCPEHLAIGTPRGIPDIHDGDGFDVIDGTARVLLDGELDVTEPLLRHAKAMADLGETCDLAILVDISGTCGSQVISRGNRTTDGVYQAAPALVAALLWKRHVPFTSQRDHRTLARLQARLDGSDVDPDLLDHHQHPWVLEHLPEGPWSLTERARRLRPAVSARQPVYKILSRAVWDARDQHVPWAPIDEQDGFLHLSAAAQVEQTLALHFAGQRDLVRIRLDPARIPALIWEASRGGALFPHAYGATPLDCVVSAEPI